MVSTQVNLCNWIPIGQLRSLSLLYTIEIRLVIQENDLTEFYPLYQLIEHRVNDNILRVRILHDMWAWDIQNDQYLFQLYYWK
jgi:hypothetical protein